MDLVNRLKFRVFAEEDGRFFVRPQDIELKTSFYCGNLIRARRKTMRSSVKM